MTGEALNTLRIDPLHRERYSAFVTAMVYGERVELGEAIGAAAGISLTESGDGGA